MKPPRVLRCKLIGPPLRTRGTQHASLILLRRLSSHRKLPRICPQMSSCLLPPRHGSRYEYRLIVHKGQCVERSRPFLQGFRSRTRLPIAQMDALPEPRNPRPSATAGRPDDDRGTHCGRRCAIQDVAAGILKPDPTQAERRPRLGRYEPADELPQAFVLAQFQGKHYCSSSPLAWDEGLERRLFETRLRHFFRRPASRSPPASVRCFGPLPMPLMRLPKR